MRWTGHVACIGERRGVYHLRERDHLEDTGVDERIIFIWTFRKCGARTGSSWLRIRTGGWHL